MRTLQHCRTTARAALGVGLLLAVAALPARADQRNGLLGVWRPQEGDCSFPRVEFTAHQQIIDTYGPERTGYPAEHTVTAVRYTQTEPGHVWIRPTTVGGGATDWKVIDQDHITPGRATGCVYRRAAR